MELCIKNSDEADGTNSTEQAQLPRMWQKKIKKKKIFTLVQMYNPTVIKEAEEEEEEGADIIICTSEKDEEFPLFRFVTVKVPDFYLFFFFLPYQKLFLFKLCWRIFSRVCVSE